MPEEEQKINCIYFYHGVKQPSVRTQSTSKNWTILVVEWSILGQTGYFSAGPFENQKNVHFSNCTTSLDHSSNGLAFRVWYSDIVVFLGKT
jgi:hypothetical protein